MQHLDVFGRFAIEAFPQAPPGAPPGAPSAAPSRFGGEVPDLGLPGVPLL